MSVTHTVNQCYGAQLAPSNRLKNIEETEKAKRTVDENRQQRKKKAKADDEEHLVAQRCAY